MQIKPIENTNFEPQLVRQTPVNKTRLAIALSLLAVMGIMWLSIFLKGRTPVMTAVATAKANATQAAPPASPVAADGPAHKLEAIFKPLPFEPGRHDVLAADVFSTSNWKAFRWDAGPGQIIGTQGYGHDQIEKVVRLLSINAIAAKGQLLEAFIEYEGQYLVAAVGQPMVVEHSDGIYEFTVEQIKGNRVVLGWQGRTFEIDMLSAE